MTDINELDKLVENNVREFEREFEINEIRRGHLSAAERDSMLTKTLGPKTQPPTGERFVVGDAAAGVSSQSVWFECRRVHFAAIVGIAVGELHDEDDNPRFCVDVNCTVRRSYRIILQTIMEADNFLVGLSQFTSFKVVPTVEDEIREQRRIEEAAAANEANAERRHRRMEFFAVRQQQLLNDLIQVECAPRISFGVLYQL